MSVTREGGSSVSLYTLAYDSMTVEPGCPSLTNGKGRLTQRNDSFGKTWFSYDVEGRVVLELRRRMGLSGCAVQPSANDKNPSTAYRYDANGNLVGLIYPHGRAVQYVHTMDRPSAIKYNTWNGSAWNATYALGTNRWTGTPTKGIDGIAWEPYGDLRGYRISSTGQWVEYYLGGSLGIAPTATSCSALATT